MGFDIDDIKRLNTQAGLHFFDKSTLRFFNSRIGRNVYGVWFGSSATNARRNGGQYFTTSERNDMGEYPRCYTVRRFNPDDNTIDTIGEFQQYKTSKQANDAAQRYASHEQITGEWDGKPEDADRNTRIDGGRLPPEE